MTDILKVGTTFPMISGITGEARMSHNGLYRYTLTRYRAKTGEQDGNRWLWVGLNPSGAAEDVDDTTVRVEWNLTWRDYQAATEQKGRNNVLVTPHYTKMNIIPIRGLDPEEMFKEMMNFDRAFQHQAVVAANFAAIIQQASMSDRVVVAFGRPKNLIIARLCMQLLSMLRTSYEGQLWCVGVLIDNWPAHPLRRTCKLQPYTVSPRWGEQTMEMVLSEGIKRVAKSMEGTRQ